jgi:isoleucyl-tRNA synthetase
VPEGLRREVAEELNVLDLSGLADAGELVELSVKPNFRVLGRRFGKGTQPIAAAIAAADPAALVSALRAGAASVVVDGATVPITGEDVVVSETPRSGWAVASSGPDTVALDLELTHELRLLGIARDIVRTIQDARKNAGLDVTDRIELRWQVGGSPEPAIALRTHQAQIAAEVLAATVHEGAPSDSVHEGAPSDSVHEGAPTDAVHEGAPAAAVFSQSFDDELGLHLWLRRAPIEA